MDMFALSADLLYSAQGCRYNSDKQNDVELFEYSYPGKLLCLGKFGRESRFATRVSC